MILERDRLHNLKVAFNNRLELKLSLILTINKLKATHHNEFISQNNKQTTKNNFK